MLGDTRLLLVLKSKQNSGSFNLGKGFGANYNHRFNGSVSNGAVVASGLTPLARTGKQVSLFTRVSRKNFVYNSVFDGLLGAKVEIPVSIVGDFFNGLTSMLG